MKTPRDGAASSDWLEAPVELHIDQHRAVALESLCEEVGRILNRLRALRHDAERAGEADEIDRRIEQLHANIAVDLHGMPMHGMQALLENAIRGVVEDDEQHP